jgi:hypothetical protein
LRETVIRVGYLSFASCTRESIILKIAYQFTSNSMDLWAYTNRLHLDFIRPRRPLENGDIEGFDRRLRADCLNGEIFLTLADARLKQALCLHDCGNHRPHSALADRTQAGSTAVCRRGNYGDKIALKTAAHSPHFHRTAASAADPIPSTSTWHSL